MKCEFCHTPLHEPTAKSVLEEAGPEPWNNPHTPERCRDALKSKLDQSKHDNDHMRKSHDAETSALKAQLDAAQKDVAEHVRWEADDGTLGMVQAKLLAAEKRAAEAERERDVFKTCIGKLDELGNEEDAVLGAVIAQRDAANTLAERFRAALEFCRQRSRMTPDSSLAHFVVCQVDAALAADHVPKGTEHERACAERLRTAIETYVDAVTDDQGTREERVRFRDVAFTNLQAAIAVDPAPEAGKTERVLVDAYRAKHVVCSFRSDTEIQSHNPACVDRGEDFELFCRRAEGP